MKDFIVKNWFKLSLMIFIICGFYWFQLRPANIRSKCLAEAEFNHLAINNSNDEARYQFINNYYNTCVRRFGLEK